jgi:hypothetical protein
MNAMRRLGDEFLAERAASGEDQSDQLAVFTKYSAEYHVLYERRAEGLIESVVAVEGDTEDRVGENKVSGSKVDI